MTEDPFESFINGEQNSGETESAPQVMPKGFRMSPHGIERMVENDEGSKWVWFCSPVKVDALTRDANSENWGRLLSIRDPDGVWHRWAMPAKLFGGDGAELRQALLDRGLNFASGKAAREALFNLLMQWCPKERARSSERLGWIDRECATFLLGDGRKIGSEEVVFQSEHVPSAAREIRWQGVLGEWREQVASACVGNPLMIVAVSLALAGPLFELLERESGGVHLRGASSRGKSTILKAAVSVWGSPRLLQSWRATDNGLEGIAAACNSSLLALDELSQVHGRVAGPMVYMLGNEQGKKRANRLGSARSSAQWRLPVLSSGEISLADKMSEAGERTRAGQEVRMLDLQADQRKHGAFDDLHGAANGAGFADRVNAAASAFFGTAGPAMVEALLEDKEACLTDLRQRILSFETAAMQICGSSSVDGQISRAISRLALIAAAGELATEKEITSWPPGTAHAAACEVFRLWLDGRGGAVSAEGREALRRTRAFLIEHGASRFEEIRPDDEHGDHQPERIIRRAGWRDDAHFFIAADAWRNEVHAGFDAENAARAIQLSGYLNADNGRLTRRMPRGVVGRPRAYAVRVEILGSDEKVGFRGGTGGTAETSLNEKGKSGPTEGDATGTGGTARRQPVPPVPPSDHEMGPGNHYKNNAVPPGPGGPTGKYDEAGAASAGWDAEI